VYACHFTNPFPVILVAFKEGAEHGARLSGKGEEVSFDWEGSIDIYKTHSSNLDFTICLKGANSLKVTQLSG
jgi:hypothetical protein